MALCSEEIYIGYTIGGKLPIVVSPFLIVPSGITNGKSSYTWFDSTWGIDVTLSWNLSGYWEIGYTSGEFYTIAILNYTPTDCPVNPYEPFSWLVNNQSWSEINTESPNPIVILTEEQECYPILVWDKQCEFAQATLKYLQQMQFGIFCCESLDKLKNKRRALEILNCYDTRDIPNNTTEYNTLTYQQIKNLLNS
jgi:hypothetical protein